MPATSAASLALASRLRELDDATLERVIRERQISPSSIRDIMDLAEAALDPASIARTLTGLTRPTLGILATAAEQAPLTIAKLAAQLERDVESVRRDLEVAQDGLLLDVVDGVVSVWPTVGEVLAGWPALGLPDARELRDIVAPTVLSSVDHTVRSTTDRSAAERAFTSTVAIAELVRVLTDEPARVLARGGLALPERKRLASALGLWHPHTDPANAPLTVGHLDELNALIELATLAGALETRDGALRPTVHSADLVDGSVSARWRLLAETWLDSIPSELLHVLTLRSAAPWRLSLIDVGSWLFPAADDSLRERIRLRADQADLLGLTAAGHPSTPGENLVTAGADAAVAALEPLLPPSVDRVYLQDDLTVVSPGPLAPPLDAALRRMADVESIGLAGRYRITERSITRAIATGETASDLLQFLSDIALTGVPQPLRYLVEQTATRYGAIRVQRAAEQAGDARTVVRCDDPVLLHTLTVDTATASLALRRIDDRHAVSRLSPEVVLETLIDARYPAAPAHGEPLVRSAPASAKSGGLIGSAAGLSVAGLSAAGATGGTNSDAIRAAVARIRTALDAHGNDGWVARQWQVALRGRLTVRARVTLPDGSEREFELEPTGISAGRVRGRDRVSAVERTLPMASITALEPLDTA